MLHAPSWADEDLPASLDDLMGDRPVSVWGEMVGMFFADVVSACDMREFLLPEFDVMRIPQWVLRSEYFKNDVHAELLWVPVPSYDRIGKPGAEFFPNQPQPPGFAIHYLNEQRPERRLHHGNYGLRISTLDQGWDLSAFYYNSLEAHLMWLSSLQRSDWLLRPRLAWSVQRNWRLMLGADIFYGAPTGLFGRYEHKDRVYGEVRYAF